MPYPQRITETEHHSFSVDRAGLYAVRVTARCRSGKQIGEREGEDMRVEIDGVSFRELPPEERTQQFDIPPAWNGTALNGLAKSVIFLLLLRKGEHTMTFVPRRGAVIEHEPTITRFDDLNNVVLDLEEQAEDGNRRPWLTVALVDLPLVRIEADITAEWHVRDSDDVKLIIDNVIERNPHALLHKYWLWSGSIFKKLFRNERQARTIERSLERGVHYIELHADRTPTLHSITIDLGDFSLPRIPTVDDPIWTGDFHDDTDQMLLARLVYGEARDQNDRAKIGVAWSVRNRVEANRSDWGSTYYDVITDPEQYSAFKVDDSNYKLVKDPFYTNNPIDRAAWRASYAIAEQVLLGTVDDPTSGSNHYYDDSAERIPSWATSESFIIKIDRIIFHRR